MNRILYLAGWWSFILLPILLLSYRAAWPKRLPWWLLLLLLSVVGWLLVCGTVHFYYAYLDDLLRPYNNHPPAALMQRRTADGAKLVFALFFGWA